MAGALSAVFWVSWAAARSQPGRATQGWSVVCGGCTSPRCTRRPRSVPRLWSARLAVDELLFQRGVEALTDGVIETVALAAGGDLDQLCSQRLVKRTAVYWALVGMVDDPRVGFALAERHL
jgi:hypothetical protein